MLIGDSLFLLVPLFFIVILGVFLFIAFKGLAEWNSNNNSALESKPVKVVAKRMGMRGGGETQARSLYFITVEFEDDSRTEFRVKDRQFGLIAEGDSGELTFQGTRFVNFTRRRIN